MFWLIITYLAGFLCGGFFVRYVLMYHIRTQRRFIQQIQQNAELILEKAEILAKKLGVQL